MNATTFRQLDADWVTDRILLGADLGNDAILIRRGLRELQDLGITDVIDTRIEANDAALSPGAAPRLAYHHLGANDSGLRMPSRWFDEVTAAISTALSRPEGKVYVHCHMGINRSPSAVVAYLLSTGMPIGYAMGLVRSARDVAYAFYADDALDWWLRKSRATVATKRAAKGELAAWRRAHPLDAEVIHAMRDVDVAEEAGSSGEGCEIWLLRLSSQEHADMESGWRADPLPHIR